MFQMPGLQTLVGTASFVDFLHGQLVARKAFVRQDETWPGSKKNYVAPLRFLA